MGPVASFLLLASLTREAHSYVSGMASLVRVLAVDPLGSALLPCHLPPTYSVSPWHCHQKRLSKIKP